jgi:MFS family permease
MALWMQRLTGIFEYEDYRQFWIGSMITVMMFRMQDVVLSWQVLEATDSAFWVGVVAFARNVPMLILSPMTGVLADQVKRQRLLAAALMLACVSTAVLALLVALDRVLVWHIVATSFLVGTAFALYSPARSALLPNLVPARMFLSASTLQYSSTRLMGFFGPIVAGGLVDVAGVWPALMVQVVLCVVAALLFARTGAGVDCPVRESDGRGNVLSGFCQVLAHLRHDQSTLALVILGLVMVPIGMSYSKLLPIFVRDILRAGASTLGVMVGISSLGSAFAGFAMAAVGDTFRKGRAVLLSSTVFGCVLVVFAFCRQAALALVLLLALGLLSGVYLTLSHVLLQVRSPDTLRGRMMGAWSMVWGLAPFANLAAGAVAERWGVTTVIGVSGAVCAVFCIGTALAGLHVE